MAEIRIEYAEILRSVLNGETSFSLVKKTLSTKETGFLNMLFLTTFRQLCFIRNEVLPKFVKKKIPQKQNILEYLLYLGATEILFMNTPDYAVINSYVEAAKAKTDKFGGNFINAVLRNILRQKDTLLKERKSGYFSKSFLKILKQDYSPFEINEMEKFVNIEPPLDLTLKYNTSLDILDGILMPTGSLRLPANTKVTEVIGFTDGDWWVQDTASSLAVKCLSNIAGKCVLDLCAAPGGKTAQLLDMGARVTAVDISESRLKILNENMQRLNLSQNLITICANALDFTPQEKFDIVLIDAPCSATGTFRRHPEMIHTKTIDDVKKQANLQQKILEHACEFLKSDGTLVYATCSLAKAEGEKLINNFIKTHTDFIVSPITTAGTEHMRTKEGYLRILPQHFKEFSGADGFFIACLKRKL